MLRIPIVVALGLGVLAIAVPPALDVAKSSGLAAHTRKDRAVAARRFAIPARLGHADAMNNLAVGELTGPRESRDTDAARRLLERAAAPALRTVSSTSPPVPAPNGCPG